MKKILCLCLLFVGCAYSPRYYMVRDSYNTNTYAPFYSPTYTTTHAPVYSTNAVSESKQKKLPMKAKKLKVKITPSRGEYQ
jgi:hypothetical protein